MLDAGDEVLRLSPMNEAPLAPEEFYVISRTVVLPVSYTVTSAYIIVRTDDGDIVEELDEANNTLASSAIEVTITPTPDLVAGDVVAPDSGIFGQEIIVDWSGENIGTDVATGGLERLAPVVFRPGAGQR